MNGPVALITGASRGIGRAIAFEFASRGARLAIHYKSRNDAAEATSRGCLGDEHRIYGADLTDTGSLPKLVEQVTSDFGRLDVLVNNAGIYETLPVKDASFDDWLASWTRTIETNLSAPAHLCFLAAQQMMQTGGGRIINITSRGAFRGEPDAMAYGASKAGLNSLGQSMAKALGGQGVFVFTVAPGFVDTEMAAEALAGPEGDGIRAQSPLGRVCRPDEVAAAVAHLAFEAPAFATGTIVDLNGASYLRS